MAGGAAVRADGALRRRLRRRPPAQLRRPPLEHRRPVRTNVDVSVACVEIENRGGRRGGGWSREARKESV